MAITSAPRRSGHPERHSQALLTVAGITVMALAAIGVALLVNAGGTTGSGVQGSGVAASQTRSVASFASLDLAGSNEVTVMSG
jgi:hypothetical protein